MCEGRDAPIYAQRKPLGGWVLLCRRIGCCSSGSTTHLDEEAVEAGEEAEVPGGLEQLCEGGGLCGGGVGFSARPATTPRYSSHS